MTILLSTALSCSQLVLIYGLNRRSNFTSNLSAVACDVWGSFDRLLVIIVGVSDLVFAMGDDLVAVIANQFISMPIWVMYVYC